MKGWTSCAWTMTFIAAALGFCRSGRAADVRFFAVTKGTYHVQTGVGAPVVAPGSSYEVHAFARLAVPNSLISATLEWPRGGVKPLTNLVTSWRYRELATSQVNLNFAAPNGTYKFSFQTTSDGPRTSSLTLSADFYPVPVHVVNYAAAQEIDAAAPFTLTWPANSADFFYVRILDGEQVVFETGPHPGTPNALPARAASVTIPAGTLRPGTKHAARITAWTRSTSDTASYPGATGWAAYTRTTDLQVQTAFPINDVHWLGLYKRQSLRQSSAAAPVPLEASPFAVVGVAEAATPLSLLQAAVRFPNQALGALAGAGVGWNWTQSFPTQQAMDAAYPAGDCTLTLATLNNGAREVILPLAATAWPSAPHVSNWNDANRIDPGQPFTLRWHPIAGATADDFLQVKITRNSEVIFKTGDHPRSLGALAGTASSIVLPGNLFEPGTTCEASVLFLKAARVDTFSYPKALAVAGAARETIATLRTRGGNHPAPRVSITSDGAGVRMRVSEAAPGWLYSVERSSDLRTWTPALYINAPAGEFDIPVGAEPGPVFLRAFVY